MGQCASWESDRCVRMRRAVKADDVLAVQRLVAAGADMDEPLDAAGSPAVLLAAGCGSARTLPLVLDLCTDPDAVNHDQISALDNALLSYALAHNMCLHKLAEQHRRYFILRMLVAAGCERVNAKEMELCVRMNEHDKVFLANLVHVIQTGPSRALKSSTLSALIAADVHHSHIRTLLLGGATFSAFLTALRSATWRTRRPLATDVVLTVVRATSDVTLLRLLVTHYSDVMKSPRSPMPASVAALVFLASGGRHRDFRRLGPSRISGASWRALLAEAPPGGVARLRHLCRTVVRAHCAINVLHAARRLPLPPALMPYITLETPL